MHAWNEKIPQRAKILLFVAIKQKNKQTKERTNFCLANKLSN